MFIDDSPGLSIAELRAKARRLVASHQVQLLVIDYLQLLRSTSRRAQDNRQIEISEISAGIKSLAKELNIPIIVIAQLNRQPDARAKEGGRPRLSDLRESGAIEQDADVVGLLVRSEYYETNEEAKQSHDVGVLFNRTRFPEIAQARPTTFFGSSVRLPVELSNHDDWNIELFGERFNSCRYFGNLDLTIVLRAPAGRTKQLQVINYEKLYLVRRNQAASLGSKLRNTQSR